MNIINRMLAALMLVSLPLAAGAVPGAQLDEQVNQLDQIVNLDKAQKREIQKILEEASVKTEELQTEMQQLKQALGAEIVPNYNERAIRKNAKKLGEVSGEMTAESALLQARIQDALTEKQRNILMERALKAQNMQQQVQ
ncbi:MAG TPA: hypothetical protein DIW43_15785 [Spongiibacteraceae bacterium]|nr:hypothetical protein [Spongiibacteraceae bacterium]HCS28919.1 hypothetical protein [Spongiibacteraceae bacterium]|tara:strand:+ start:1286 stop:1705 length:420 start_codon:yes stop_codon:yes gene_type:complete